MNARRHAACWIGALVACAAQAGPPGAFDAAWGADGRVVIAAQDSSFVSYAVAAVGDRLRLAGACGGPDGSEGCAAGLDPTGSPDPDYGLPAAPDPVVRARAIGLGPPPEPQSAAIFAGVDATGRVSWLRATNGGMRDIARLDASGRAADVAPRPIDLLGGEPGDQRIVALDGAGGTTVVAGGFRLPGGNFDVVVARLDDALQLDPTFNGTGVRRLAFDGNQASDDFVADVAVGPDGRVYVAVQVFPIGGGASSFWVTVFAPDGTLADGFGLAGRTQVPIAGAETLRIAVDAEGRVILAGGYAPVAGSPNLDIFVSRLTPAGLFDPSFGTAGVQRFPIDLVVQAQDLPNAVLVQPDGKPVVVGRAPDGERTGRFFVARLDTDGALDPAFGADGLVVAGFDRNASDGAFDEASAVVLDDERRLYVVGLHLASSGAALRAGAARLLTGLPGNAVFADDFE